MLQPLSCSFYSFCDTAASEDLRLFSGLKISVFVYSGGETCREASVTDSPPDSSHVLCSLWRQKNNIMTAYLMFLGADRRSSNFGLERVSEETTVSKFCLTRGPKIYVSKQNDCKRMTFWHHSIAGVSQTVDAPELSVSCYSICSTFLRCSRVILVINTTEKEMSGV